jgi:hypothetical protein
MFHMLGHHANEMGCPSAGVGGWIDHVHVLCQRNGWPVGP